MKRIFIALFGILAALPLTASAARVVSDLQPPQKRQLTVSTAERLTHRKSLDPLPGDLASPFNPVDFDRPDPSDTPVSRQADARPGAAKAPVVLTNRETLELLSAQINPSGVIMLRGAPRLMIGGKPFEIGTRFTASYNSRDYELELTAIDRTTFTLRYRGEEFTRPIKPVR